MLVCIAHGRIMHYRMFVLCLILLLGAGTTYANEDFRFGIMPTGSRYDVKDPDGSTSPENDLNPLSGVLIYNYGRDGRIFTHLYSASFSLKASPSDIGQDVTQVGLNATYQMMVRMARSFKPWIGLGLGYASEDYRNRHRITPEGHLAPGSPYPSRKIDNYVGVLNASLEWQANRDWDVGAHLQVEEPISSDGARAFRLGVYFVY